jgi:anaerobic selenocysteine-containing dehydrogenase
MVSVDIYLNETTRYANVILPPLPALVHSHYDLSLYQLAVQNIAHYSPPVIEREAGMLDEWEILLSLAAILAGQGVSADPSLLDNQVIAARVQREIATSGSPIAGRDAAEILAALQPRRGPERMLDFLLRSGPYGDGFGMQQGLSLSVLEANPHGVDLGPLSERVPEVLRTPSGQIELAPQVLVKDVERLRASLEQEKSASMLLIGRRDLRSNNSWMHNLHVLTKGKDRCTLHIHPNDAARLNLTDGEIATVTSASGSVEIPTEITAAIMPGVVSIPHGWGHDLAGTRMRIAREHAGVNVNVLVDGGRVDPLSGNAVLNGIAVEVGKSVGE